MHTLAELPSGPRLHNARQVCRPTASLKIPSDDSRVIEVQLQHLEAIVAKSCETE